VSHSRTICVHGTVIEQCRCPSPHKETRVQEECPFPEHEGWLQVGNAAVAAEAWTELLVPDDTVPVERLARWLHDQYGPRWEDWNRMEGETVRDAYRRDARRLRIDLPELFQ
jgi:hypothetical protein